MEPRASTPQRRLDAIRALATAGIPVGVMTSPMIPGLNDHEMESILEAAMDAGATRAGYIVLRLPLEIKELFEEWLKTHRPDRAERVLSLIRQMRGGKLYDAEFGSRRCGCSEHRLFVVGRGQGAFGGVDIVKSATGKALDHFNATLAVL